MMKSNKYLLVVLSILILFVFIASASAADANTTQVLSVDESANIVNNDTNILSADNNDVSNDNVLKEKTGSYSELAAKITDAQSSGNEVTLDENCIYKYDSGNTIQISKLGFKVEGNGATIDMANSNIQVFKISARNVIINNLTIKNVNFSNMGGAISFNSGNNGSVTNCNFINNTATRGCGAISFNDVGSVVNCTFTGNNGKNGAGAIGFLNNGGSVVNCTFTGNTGNNGGAILFFNGGYVNNCTFTGNIAENKGGAISIRHGNSVNNCVLVNNIASTCSEIHILSGIDSLDNNWWGSNNPNWANLISGGYVPSRYAVLNVTADPSEIPSTGKSNIVTKFIWNGTNTDATNLLPKRNVKLTTNGTLTETEGDVGLTSQFSATAEGIYYVNATSDNEILGVNVNVTGSGPVTDIWYVNVSASSGGNGSEEKPFNTLKDALNVARDGNTIMIASGEYKGTDNTNLTINKNLNFIKYGDGEAIFDAEGQSQIWAVQSTSINITGLTFKNGKADNGGAILFRNSLSNSNINASFINNTAEICGGAIATASSLTNVTFDGIYINNTVNSSEATAAGGAIFILTDDAVNGLTIDGIYINNTANASMQALGGANIIYAKHAVANITIGGIYINNTANASITAMGGANLVVSEGALTNVDMSGIYISNKAISGGAASILFLSSNNINIHDAIFINNNNTINASEAISAVNCWFGNNATNYNITPENIGNVIITDWLFLNATANPTEINVGETSEITFKLDSYNSTSNTTSSYDASKMHAILKVSQTLGELNKNTTLIGEEVIYTAKQEGNASVTGKFVTAYYTVNIQNIGPKEAEIIIDEDTVSLDVDEATSIRVSVEPSEAGTLKFDSYDSRIIEITYIGIQLTIKGKQEGTTTIKVSLDLNPGYKQPEDKYITVTVKAKDAEIIIDKDTFSLNVSESAPTGARVEPSEAGSLEYQSNDTNIVEIGRDSEGNPIIIGLAEGTAKITVHLNPKPGYKQVEDKYITVNVGDEPAPSINVIAENLTKYYGGSEQFIVNVTDNAGKGISNKTASITINGENYNRTTDENGIASLNINLPSGNYTATVTVDSITVNATVTVSPTITGSNITSETRNVTYNVWLVDSKGESIENGTIVEFNINGIIYKSPVIDDIASVDLILNSGNYTITATNPKTKENQSNKIIINAKDITIEAEAEPITAGENATVIVTGFVGPDGNLATGNVTVTAAGNNFTGIVSNDGKAIIKVAGLNENTTAGVYYHGDNNFNPASTTVNITVYPNPDRKNLTLEASAEPITLGENATIIVTGFENATGNVGARIEGGLLPAPIVNGNATFTVPGLTSNTTVYIIYEGDANYNPANTTVNIIVYPNPDRKNLTLEASAEAITVGENVTIIVTGFENATGDVGARIEGGLLSAPIVDGAATFTVPGLTSNTTAYIIYEGDVNYNPANTTVNITVNPKSDVVIVAENVTKYYGGPERFVANIYDPEGNPLVNKSVNITINGITYTRTTDDNGTVSLAIRLGGGIYDVTTQVDNTTVKSSVTVLSTVIGSDLTKYYKNKTQYSVQVYDTNGTAVGKGEVVTFNINGIFYNRTTDENGIATLNINLPPGNYIVTTDYKGCKVANNITVLPVLNATDITMKYLDGKQFKANLVDGQGKPYADQFITFNVNGVLYNRLTDSNGQAALNIRLIPGEYIITSSFNGANIANKITISG